MTPTPSTSPKTTAAGILSLILGILGLINQAFGLAQGKTMDPNVATTNGGLVVAGAGLIKAKDN